MTEATQIHERGKGHRIFAAALTMLLTAIAIVWAWNGAGAELFSLPEAKFSQIFAIIIAIVSALALVKAVFDASHHRRGS